MTEPCEARGDIQEIKKDLAGHQQRITNISENGEHMREEMKDFMVEVRKTLQALRDFTTAGEQRMKHGEEKFDLLFSRTRYLQKRLNQVEDSAARWKGEGEKRCVEAEKQVRKEVSDTIIHRVEPLEDYIKAQQTKSILLKDLRVTIPVLCTVIITGLTLYTYFTG